MSFPESSLPLSSAGSGQQGQGNEYSGNEIVESPEVSGSALDQRMFIVLAAGGSVSRAN